MIELIKCPFCGGEAGLRMGAYGDTAWIWCECEDCSMKSSVSYADISDEKTAVSNILQSIQEASEKWNRRDDLVNILEKQYSDTTFVFSTSNYEIPDGYAEFKIKDALIYENPNGDIVFDADKHRNAGKSE